MNARTDIQTATALNKAAFFVAVVVILFFWMALSRADSTNTTWDVKTNTFTFSVVTSNRLDTITAGATTNSVPPPVIVSNVVLVASSLNPTGPFWVKAIITGLSTVQKVEFWDNGAMRWSETQAPYFLFGDDGTNPLSGTLPAGPHIIVARAYTNATGYISSQPITVTVSGSVLAAPFGLVVLGTMSFTNGPYPSPYGGVAVVTNWPVPSVLLTWHGSAGQYAIVQRANGLNASESDFKEIAKIPFDGSEFGSYEDTPLPPSTGYSYKVGNGEG